MLSNFFKIAFRNLRRNKGYSFLNIFGLSMGMASALLIILWVQHEKSVDAFHRNGPQLYSIYEQQYFDGKKDGGYYTPGLLADEMKRVIPEIKNASGFAWNDKSTFQVGDKILKEEGNKAGRDFFKMFSFQLLEGKADAALATPVSIAISRNMASHFFGTPSAAIGKTIRFENRKDLTVTAVFENISAASSLKFEFLLNWKAWLDDNSWAKDWGNNGPGTFIQLRPDANPVLVRKKIKKFLDTYNKDQSKAFRIELNMQPFPERYLQSNFKNGDIVGGRIEYVRIFSVIAIFILLIACINFMNLTTARSLKRSKEIGVRKVVGALRWNLVRQFLSEAVMLSFFAVIIACLLILVILPGFNALTGQQISYPFGSLRFWLILLVLTLVTGIISGSYPALFLSSFKPIRVLKGAMKFSTGAQSFRKGLVIFQFCLSTLLIIGTIVIARQVHYVQSINLGYDRENLIYLPLEGELIKNYQVLREATLRLPGVMQFSRVSQSPTQLENGTGGVDWDGKDPSTLPMFTQLAVGYDFTNTMKLRMNSGRDFSRDFSTDTSNYILNETAVRKIGYKDPVGKRLTMWGKKGVIIGVVKDFHFNSMHNPINPLIIRLEDTADYGAAVIRTAPGKAKQTIAGLEQLCKQLNPNFPFAYTFSDEEYKNMYKSEQMVGKLSNWFSFLAILISCLGLLGLAMFTAEQRTREFGIRKVLGAEVHSLFALLSREFLILVIIAFVIASPVAWLLMNQWLNNYAYHTPIQWWFFAVAGVAAILVALFTVSFQAARAALANPIKSLRSE